MQFENFTVFDIKEATYFLDREQSFSLQSEIQIWLTYTPYS